MAILAGIDEAGFGPTLGPLVVSGVAFRVPDDHLDGCLWDTLQVSCTSTVRKSGRRLVITDSKKLHRGGEGLGALERTALVMLAAGGHRPDTFRTLLDLVSPGAGDQLNAYPWYGGTDLALPLDPVTGDVGTQANAVRLDCEAQDVVPAGVFCEPVPVGVYNRLVRNTRNKAVVLLGLALRVVDRVMRSAPQERIRVFVDRLGGRTHYRPALTTAFPGYTLRILEESSTRSAYQLDQTAQCFEIEFVTRGDAKRFPVALASIYSKYLRELHMHAFNRYWSEAVPGLRPTAGYYTDAKRWLQEASAELKHRSVDRTLLVRER